MAEEAKRIAFDKLKKFCQQAYMKVGVPAEEAEIVADLLVRADLRGVETHGVTRLPIYIQRLQKGYVRKVSQISVLKERGATVFLDAHGSMGHIAAYRAMEQAIENQRSKNYKIKNQEIIHTFYGESNRKG